MTIDDFQAWMQDHWHKNSQLHHNDLFYLAACAQGEAGELFKPFKKVQKMFGQCNLDDLSSEQLEEAILEAGDTIHYILRMLQVMGVSLEEVLEKNKTKIEHRYTNHPDWNVG